MKIRIDEDKCTGCGLCDAHCTEDVVAWGPEGRPVIEALDHCLECHHCEAVCPSGALVHGSGPVQQPPAAAVVEGDAMARFLTTKRSCRHFRQRLVDRTRIARLLDVACAAPSSKNCEERVFLVVTDRAKLEALRADLVRNNRRILRLLRVMTARPVSWLLPSETVDALRRMKQSFVHCLQREAEGHDSIFYGAPAVVFIGGIAQDPFGKDNALAAQHYLMAQAEADGLGSCIMGYAQAAPKILARHLEVPRFYRIYGVVALGHPKHRFARAARRKPASVTWVEGAESDGDVSLRAVA
jgi:nitroreductase/NAD-dependent dihydropyrimidine dehydrogenase PreA subunit